MQDSRRIGDAVREVLYGTDARVVREAGAADLVDGPQALLGDGEVRRPVSAHLLSGEVLELRLCLADVIAKFLPRHPRCATVRVTVAGDLVPFVHHAVELPQDSRRNTRQDEERRVNVALGEEIEEPVGVPCEIRREAAA